MPLASITLLNKSIIQYTIERFYLLCVSVILSNFVQKLKQTKHPAFSIEDIHGNQFKTIQPLLAVTHHYSVVPYPNHQQIVHRHIVRHQMAVNHPFSHQDPQILQECAACYE